VLGIARRVVGSRVRLREHPLLVISHAAPAGAGDAPADPYHAGFPAYRWLLDELRPPLWLHGHTTTATVPSLLVRSGPTTLVNVTGAVLLEIVAPGTKVGDSVAAPASQPADPDARNTTAASGSATRRRRAGNRAAPVGAATSPDGAADARGGR
jgi:hypothetical protein